MKTIRHLERKSQTVLTDGKRYYYLNSTEDVSSPAGLRSATFTNSDLVAGVLTVTHSLGIKHVNPIVYDNNSEVINPDSVIMVNTASLTIDLSSYGTITGTWTWKIFLP